VDRTAAVVVTLIVGGLVALQPPANALLARVAGDLGAAFVSLVIATAIVGVLLVAFGDPAQLRGVSLLRPEYLIGGVAGAAVVAVTLITVRPLGAGGVTAALVAMQLIVSAVADRFGWLGLERDPLGWQGGAAVVLLLAGTLLMTTR